MKRSTDQDSATGLGEHNATAKPKIAITTKQLRALIREAIDIVNKETGEVFDFGEESISGLPDEAVPDLVSRLGLDLSPGGQLSNDDFDKLEQL